MEPALMMRTALVLLTLTAIGGVAMAGIRFSRNANPPSWLAMGHGLLAGAALTLLIYAYFTVGLPSLASWSLLLFLAAGAGGTYLNLAFHAKGAALPKNIVIGHGALAVVAYALLAGAVFLR